MNEVWHDIDGFSKYQVSNTGIVRNKESGRIVKSQPSPDGYLKVGLRRDDGCQATRMVHKLVAEAFVHNPNPSIFTIVNHIDQNRTNANANNLEWVSAKGNANHSNRNEMISLSREVPINEYDRNGRYLRTWKSESRLAKYYNVSKDTVSHAMAFQTFVKGRYFKKWNGAVHDINLQHRVCKSELADYSVFGEINQDDLFEAQSVDEKYEEIKNRETGVEHVTVPIMKADMAFLAEYVHRLERIIKKQVSKAQPQKIVIDNSSEQNDLNDPILSMLQRGKVEYVDNRSKGGALWIIGGEELTDVVEHAKQYGITFRFARKGGNATQRKPGWWAK